MKVDIQGLERDPMLRGRVGRLVGAALETIKAAPIRARVTFFDDQLERYRERARENRRHPKKYFVAKRLLMDGSDVGKAPGRRVRRRKLAS